jgi:hypothetical protein
MRVLPMNALQPIGLASFGSALRRPSRDEAFLTATTLP